MTNRRVDGRSKDSESLYLSAFRRAPIQEASSSSNRPFSGANWLLVSGRVTLKIQTVPNISLGFFGGSNHIPPQKNI